MEIIVGTYENFLVGYQLQLNDKVRSLFCHNILYLFYQLVFGLFFCFPQKTLELKQSFTDDAHCGSIRAICSSKKYVATGSVDEIIHLVNMKHRVDAGAFNLHNGTVTALQFYGSKHLFSASEDNNIAVFSIPKRKCEKILRGHSAAVTALALHSTGKLLLTVSKDKTLRTWNLVKGRSAYIINLKEVANKIQWAPCQTKFAVVFDSHVDIYDISTGSVVKSLDKTLFDKRIENVVYLNDQYLIIYGDSSSFVIVDLESDKVVQSVEAHENRIKDMQLVDVNNVPEELQLNSKTISHLLVSVSNDGFIKVWSLNLDKFSKPTLITSLNTTCRPTCLAVWTEKDNQKSAAPEPEQ